MTQVWWKWGVAALLGLVVLACVWFWSVLRTQWSVGRALEERDEQWRRALAYDYQGDDFEEDPLIASCRRAHAERMMGLLIQRVREIAVETGNKSGLALWKSVKHNLLGGGS